MLIFDLKYKLFTCISLSTQGGESSIPTRVYFLMASQKGYRYWCLPRNGVKFDWSVLKEYPYSKPFFLSGGIGIEDISQLQEFKKSTAATYCYGVDLNSKFELAPAKKDTNKLEKFKQLL